MANFYGHGKPIILFICEGKHPEKEIIDLIAKEFSETFANIHLIYFQSNIYTLYNALKAERFNDDGLSESIDIVEFMKERDVNNVLEGINDTDIAKIFLFFDFDGQTISGNHPAKAAEEYIQEMLEFFSNEDDSSRGKLYISYPMAEAFYHKADKGNMCQGSECHKCFFPARKKYNNDGINFKKIINDSKAKQKGSVDYFSSSLPFQIQKLKCLVKKDGKVLTASTYESLCSQNSILDYQRKYFFPDDQLMILSAFYLFLIDYFGFEKISLQYDEKANPRIES